MVSIRGLGVGGFLVREGGREAVGGLPPELEHLLDDGGFGDLAFAVTGYDFVVIEGHGVGLEDDEEEAVALWVVSGDRAVLLRL